MASIWTVGDIHGEAARLKALLTALPRRPDDTTVFLGDYIDRGPDSAAVVRCILAEHDAAPDRTVLLWGNHEDMAAHTFKVPYPSGIKYDPYDWFRNGGIQTMESYGSPVPAMFGAPCPDDIARLLGLLRTFWRAEEPALAPVIWVHAGVLPGKQPEDCTGETLVWVRDEFLNVWDQSGRVVIHGHTPAREVKRLKDKIGMDTGAVFGGLLSALQIPESGLDDARLYQTDRRGRTISLLLPGR